MNQTIELCGFYTTTGYPDFKPKCSRGHFAGLWCHNRDRKHYCGNYLPTKQLEKPEVSHD